MPKETTIKHAEWLATDEIKSVHVNNSEMQECLEQYRKTTVTASTDEDSSVLDAAVFVDNEGCIQIFHKNGGWIRCVPFVADVAPFAG